jgi:hypothetical protein
MLHEDEPRMQRLRQEEKPGNDLDRGFLKRPRSVVVRARAGKKLMSEAEKSNLSSIPVFDMGVPILAIPYHEEENYSQYRFHRPSESCETSKHYYIYI